MRLEDVLGSGFFSSEIVYFFFNLPMLRVFLRYISCRFITLVILYKANIKYWIIYNEKLD